MTLKPGESRAFGLRLLVSDEIKNIERTPAAVLDVDERIVEDLIAACRRVADKVSTLPPPSAK